MCPQWEASALLASPNWRTSRDVTCSVSGGSRFQSRIKTAWRRTGSTWSLPDVALRPVIDHVRLACRSVTSCSIAPSANDQPTPRAGPAPPRPHPTGSGRKIDLAALRIRAEIRSALSLRATAQVQTRFRFHRVRELGEELAVFPSGLESAGRSST